MKTTLHECLNLDIDLELTACFGKPSQMQHGYLFGAAFDDDELLSTHKLENCLKQAIENRALPELLARLNGFFSIIFFYQQKLYLCVDKLRSKPLFYCQWQGRLLVSDSAQHLVTLHPELADYDDLHVEEFRHTGYVTGAGTLLASIRQVPSCSYVEHDGHVIRQQHYFALPVLGAADASQPMHELELCLDALLVRCIQRLLQYAGGRQIVLPLSGGYDSRALALALKKSGYTNIFTFSFGRAGSPEVAKGEMVAKALGLAWTPIIYSRKDWRVFAGEQEFSRFLQFGHQYASVPPVQVILALHQLRRMGVVQPDAVFVPGHTADFLSGGHRPILPSSVTEHECLEAACQAIIRSHYALSAETLSQPLRAKLYSELAALMDQGQYQDAATLCEVWNFKERQAKFIVNSNRYYDFYGYDWWMPFWDNEFIEYWQSVSAESRLNKQLWIHFIEQQMQVFSIGGPVSGNADVKTTKWSARLYRYSEYWTDLNLLYVLVPFKRWFFWRYGVSKKPGSLFGWLCEQLLPPHRKH
ncbi:asparagine synthetase B family protein [Rheinheimera sp.]|uniref:asparagine synthetase B family protein n=1 Tax=Rheinheimera sp. TaxID=1869214 RepID=UPI00307E7BD7